MSTNFKFRMSEVDLMSELNTIPATEKAFVALVQKLFQATAEHVAIQQNGKLLNALYSKITSAKFKLTFRTAAVSILPVTYEKDKDCFTFKQSKVLAIAHKQGWDIAKPKEGEPFSDTVAEKLATHLSGVLSAVTWIDYKPVRESAASGELTAEKVKAALIRLQNKAKEADIDWTTEVEAQQSNITNDVGEFGELTPLFRELKEAAVDNPTILLALKQLVAAHAASVDA